MAHRHAAALAQVAKSILTFLPTKYARLRLTGPRQSLLLLLASIQSGIDRMGVRSARLEVMKRMDAMLGWSAERMPSTSACCRALRKLPSSMLESVMAKAHAAVVKAYGSDLLIHQRRLVAIDGVRINAQRTSVLARWLGLPKTGTTTQAHQPQALVVVARCVRTGVVLAQEVVRHTGSERACARRLIRRISTMGPLLVVLDRGFPARDLIGLMVEHRIDFVLRIWGGPAIMKELQGCERARRVDTSVDIAMRNAKNRGMTANLRVIVNQRAKRGRPRCDRTPQRLILLTTLKGQYWSSPRIIALYHRRWDIETTFREDKRLLGATRSRATTREGFMNELLALAIYRILMALIAAMVLTSCKAPMWDDPRAKRLTTSQLMVMAWWLVEVALTKSKNYQAKISDLTREIGRDSARKRPGRSYRRICKGAEGVWKIKSGWHH